MSSTPTRAPTLEASYQVSACARCERSLEQRWAFRVGDARHCLRCALRYPPMLRRSAWTAVVVGTILIAINQGTFLVAGQFPGDLFWKIPLTYVVPFVVASWGALSNARG